MVETLCALFDCEEMIKGDDRNYQFKSIIIDPLQGIFLFFTKQISS